jgi:hypothetical protein
LVSRYTRSPSTAGDEQMPDRLEVDRLAAGQLGDGELPEELAGLLVEAQQDAPVAVAAGSRGRSLFVPTYTRPPATVGLP